MCHSAAGRRAGLGFRPIVRYNAGTMRVFLVGGAQEACHSCAAALRRRNHEVTVLVEAARTLYHGLGVEIMEGSIFDLGRVEEGLARHDVAIFFGTELPLTLVPSQADLGPYDRKRREGTRNFMAAVLRQRVPFCILVSSVVVYGNCGERLVDERAALNPPRLAQSFADMEDVASQGGEFQGLKHAVLRAGLIYSARSWHTRGLLDLLASGNAPPLAGEGAYVSPIHAEDLGEAVACAAEKAPPGAVMNIVDDEPVRLRDLLIEAARALGVKPPGALPSFVLRLSVGKDVYQLIQMSCRANNAVAKKILGWKPRFPSILEQLKEEVARWREERGAADRRGGGAAQSPAE
jgi:nucleoside-diphosphate-sugar epimerase